MNNSLEEQMNKLDLSVIILAYNEEIHIKRCIENASRISNHIYVIDSYSSDNTVQIARNMGAEVLAHKWENNYAKQFNWALENCNIKSKWILRLDADEYLLEETIKELYELLPSINENISSISMPLVKIWMGKQLHKGTGKIILKRIFRNGFGRCEERLMDEHIVTSEGYDLTTKNGFADENLNDLSWWAHKHVNYAVREAIDLLNIEYHFLPEQTIKANMNQQATAKRRQKERYAKLPLFWRAFAYFCLRYFIKGGIFEGIEGFCWHFFQGLWYRMFVDAKVYEIKKVCGSDTKRIVKYVKTKYGISLS